MRLLIFKLVQLGDNVVFLPVVQALRAHFPDWPITLLTTPREAALYEACVPADCLWTAPQLRFNASWKRPWEFSRWWLRVRRFRPEACLISFDQGNTAHLIAQSSGARLRVGARIAHVKFPGSITHDVPLPEGARVADWHWAMATELLRARGCLPATWPASPPLPDLSHLLLPGGTPDPGRPRIVLHAGSNQAFTRWPLERFASLAGLLTRHAEVVWIDRPETSQATLDPGVRRVSPDSLQDLARLLSRSSLFVGNNSGPMHLANALGVPGVVISGPTHFAWDPAWHRDRWTLLRHPSLPCLPCEWTEAYRLVRDCHREGDRLACLLHWTVEQVHAACLARLAASPPSR